MKNKTLLFFILFIFLIIWNNTKVSAEDGESAARMRIYNQYSISTNIPWYYIAAIDQFERNTKRYRSYCKKEDEIISICIDPKVWAGDNNPNGNDKDPYTIKLFYGIGIDGNKDGYADRENNEDKMTTFLHYILDFGVTTHEIHNGLMHYYENEKSVGVIFEIAGLFSEFNSIDLTKRVFPIPRGYNVGYTDNYGTGRSYGGVRTHEGVDLFADYGTPVLSTAFGVVEIKGWNRFGGYRIGIRDMFNTYEFYAHLSHYAKGIKEGSIVKPGQVIGYVGSTGYGKEGTSGKFPPHLHYGLYKYNGKTEWSFDPYSYLRKWEKVSLSRNDL